ncbi:MAG: c-type cytochrome [Longimicrobiales bacterium]
MSSARGRMYVVPLVVACTALGIPVGARGQFPPDSFTNLKVLPRTIHRDTLVRMMAGFTRALGVRCSYCHVGEENRPLETYNFASDDKLPKRQARTMLEMVGRINGTHLASLDERADPPVRVECFTCHRGIRRPRALQEMLTLAYQAAGADSAVSAYHGLRSRYYGRAIYDFTEVALADLADIAMRAGRAADAERFHELNVQHNPASQFARLNLVRVALTRAFAELGADSGAVRYAALKARFGGTAFPEPLLNDVGYAVLRRNVSVAVRVFRLNVSEYPQASNVYDSLGEALAANGEIAEAIRNYERSLQLDPGNTNAREKLTELRRRRPR